jgi:hypothetical protein
MCWRAAEIKLKVHAAVKKAFTKGPDLVVLQQVNSVLSPFLFLFCFGDGKDDVHSDLRLGGPSAGELFCLFLLVLFLLAGVQFLSLLHLARFFGFISNVQATS